MSEAKIEIVRVDRVDPNPWRDLDTYPPIRRKVDALKASIADVGLWESLIVRPSPGNRGHFEQAFGHQRLYAVRELGLKEIPTIVRKLSDEQMLQFMGRENGEDYTADFLILLNTWEAGVNYLASKHGKDPAPTQVARLLGWTRFAYKSDRNRALEQLDGTSEACNAAMKLISAGHLAREDLNEISVAAASEIVERTLSRMQLVDNLSKVSGATPEQTRAAKEQISTGARRTAHEVREGRVAKKDIRSRVDLNTLDEAKRNKEKLPPTFEPYTTIVIGQLAKMINGDKVATKLEMIAQALDYVVEPRHRSLVRQVDRELEELGNRTADWRKRLVLDKVTPIKPTLIGGPKS